MSKPYVFHIFCSFNQHQKSVLPHSEQDASYIAIMIEAIICHQWRETEPCLYNRCLHPNLIRWVDALGCVEVLSVPCIFSVQTSEGYSLVPGPYSDCLWK